MERQLLTMKEAARLAGVGLSTAYEYVACGEWPKVKLGKAARVPRTSLDEWIRAKTEEAERVAAELRETARAGWR